MATCIQTANDVIAGPGYDSLTNIFPSTITPFTTSISTNALFKLQIPNFQTINFTFTLTNTPYASTLSILRVVGSVVTPIASANLNSSSTTVTADLSIGQYIICLRSNNAQTGSFVGSFTGYASSVFMSPSGRSGQEAVLAELKTRPKPRECSEALYFEIVDGALPPGLVIDSLGTIRGRLPNLDCVPDPLSPSMNWSYQENDGTLWPWGRQWRFQVELWIASQPEIRVTEWFCVKIHNNWDFDRDKFLELAPFEHVEKIKVVEPPKQLPAMICEPCGPVNPTREIFVPTPLSEDECPACSSPNQSTSIELIPIPDELCDCPANELLVWFEENREGDDTNPNIAKFKRDLSNSESFRYLRERAGYVPGDQFTDEQRALIFVTASNYQNFLQLAQVRLNPNASDLGFLVELWKNQENQALPITGLSHDGAVATVQLK